MNADDSAVADWVNAGADFCAEGGCACGASRYRLTRAPLFVNCCHCASCRLESGAAFAVNALVESAAVEVLTGQPVAVDTPSDSGKGQRIVRCPACRVALWSHYGGAGDSIAFIRVGTLDEPSRFPPRIHIYTASKLPWVKLPADVPAVAGFYSRREHWPAESLARLEALRPNLVIPEDRKTMRFSAYVFHLSGISRIKRGVNKRQFPRPPPSPTRFRIGGKHSRYRSLFSCLPE